jgi:hypothetical protein
MTSTIGSLAPPADGARFAGVVWGASLVQLPAMGLAPPVWKYPPQQLASDVAFDLVYGVGVGVGVRGARPLTPAAGRR